MYYLPEAKTNIKTHWATSLLWAL